MRSDVVTAEELAFLVGGRRRLAETVIAGLVADGRVRVSGEGALHPVSGGPPPYGRPLQLAALAAVGGGGRSAGAVLQEVAASAPARDVRTHLATRQLVPPPRPGVLRVVPTRSRTPGGDALVAGARAYWVTGAAGAGVDPAMLSGVAGRVALGGWEAYPDQLVATALVTARTKHEAKRKADGSCGSGDSGCGGGGCGGGCGS